MSDKLVFRGPVVVELFGDTALEFIEKDNQAIYYKVIGFEHPVVSIEDHRKMTFNSLEHFFQTDDPGPFLEQFNSPAMVEIRQQSNGDYSVLLSDTNESGLEYIFWISVGVGKYIPVYDYVFIESIPMAQDQFALISIYYYPAEVPAVLQPAFCQCLQV